MMVEMQDRKCRQFLYEFVLFSETATEPVASTCCSRILACLRIWVEYLGRMVSDDCPLCREKKGILTVHSLAAAEPAMALIRRWIGENKNAPAAVGAPPWQQGGEQRNLAEGGAAVAVDIENEVRADAVQQEPNLPVGGVGERRIVGGEGNGDMRVVEEHNANQEEEERVANATGPEGEEVEGSRDTNDRVIDTERIEPDTGDRVVSGQERDSVDENAMEIM